IAGPGRDRRAGLLQAHGDRIWVAVDVDPPGHRRRGPLQQVQTLHRVDGQGGAGGLPVEGPVGLESDLRGGTHAGQTPEVPRRCEFTRWVSTIPIASMRANIVVGPTNANPSFLSAFDRANDSGDWVG